MRRVHALTALAAVPFIASAALAASAVLTVARVASREEPKPGAVTALSVLPASGRADVVIAVDGAITVVDFTLSAPYRVVVDLRGATLGVAARLYDRVMRGGITNVRMAQYQPGIVRVVLDLDGPRSYSVVREAHAVRIGVNGPGEFAAWHLGGSAAATASLAVREEPSPTSSAEPPSTAAPLLWVAPSKTSASQSLSAPLSPPTSPQQSQERRITWSGQDAHIRDVIQMFAQFGGRSIVVGKSVEGLVTAEIKDQPWDVALKYILAAQGLAAIEQSNGMIIVDSYANIAEQAKVEPLQTRVIQVNYAKAETMANTVRSLLGAGCGGGGTAPKPTVDNTAAAGAAPAQNATGGTAPVGASTAVCSTRGSVSFDEKTNSIIVTEAPGRLDDIASYVATLDVRTPQVAIKAKIISVDRSGTENLGISYDLGTSTTFSQAILPRLNGDAALPGDFRVNIGGDGLASVANASRSFKGNNSLSLIYNMTLGGFNLTSFLDALSEVSLTDVQAEPSTTTVDNREAELFAGNSISYLLTPATIPGQVSQTSPTPQQQNIGITLRVTPHVTANRQVLMSVYAEQQTLQSVTIAGPNTSKRTSRNEVLVADGETAVIGGLTQTQVVRTKRGIPFLMNLPVIGRLFSETSNVERKQDLLILVTPHIIDEGEIIRPPAPIKPESP